VSICLATRCRAFLLPGFRAGFGGGGAGGSVAARCAVTAATGSAVNCGWTSTCCSRAVSLSLQLPMPSLVCKAQETMHLFDRHIIPHSVSQCPSSGVRWLTCAD
jgi:hypothetical protein